MHWLPWWGWIIGYGIVALAVVYGCARTGMSSSHGSDGMVLSAGAFWPLALPIMVLAAVVCLGEARYEAAKKIAAQRAKDQADVDLLLRREGILPGDD